MNRVIAQTGVAYPIVQAPMGWIARAQLASAISNAGGLGIIETSSGETDNCIAEIAKMRELTDRPFGINLPLLFLRDARMVDAVCEAPVTFVSTASAASRANARWQEDFREGRITPYSRIRGDYE